MSLGVLAFAAIDIAVIAAYCFYYKPKSFYGGYPAELWEEDTTSSFHPQSDGGNP